MKYFKQVSYIKPTFHYDISFILILLYYLEVNDISSLVLAQKNQFFIFRCLIGTVIYALENFLPSYYLNICPVIFIKLIYLCKLLKFQFLFKIFSLIVNSILQFYSLFFEKLLLFYSVDRTLFKQFYSFDLSPLGTFLLYLICQVDKQSKFNPDLFVPLFHLYIKDISSTTRHSVMETFNILIENEYEENNQNFTRF